MIFVPDTETELDLLYFEPIAVALTTLIDVTSEKPVTVGIHGDWGAGKSSIMKMVQKRLAERKDVLVIHFDGWRFQGFDDAKTVLLETIVQQLLASTTFGAKIKDEAVTLLKRIKWLKLAKTAGQFGLNYFTGLPTPSQVQEAVGRLGAMASDPSAVLKGADVAGVASSLSEHVGERPEETVAQTVQAFTDEFQGLLRKTGLKKLVVLIDDLDRCLPATTIETLEAIRLFLFVERTAFVVAADEGMIEYAVRQHFPDLPASTSSTSYARNYLEKLIQTPFRLSPLGVEEAKVYVTLLLVQAITGDKHPGFRSLVQKAMELIRQPWLTADLKHEDVLAVDPAKKAELNGAYQLALQVGRTVAEGTSGNPRQIKRFLNALAVRQAIASARGLDGIVSRDVLAKLMLAERFRPDFHNTIALAALAAPTGTVPDLAELETAAAEPDKRADVSEAIAEWLKDKWLTAWATMQPPLGALDLRPYAFMARDKRAQLGSAVVSETVNAVLAALSGGAMALASAQGQIKALNPGEVDTVFNIWRDQIVAASSLKAKPDAFEGLCRLVELHPQTHDKFVALLETFDTKQLGVWVCAGWRPDEWQGAARAKAREVLRTWANAKDNKSLKAAAGPPLAKLGVN
jgi:predicted KAP-like P-loop ATPase